MDKMVYSTIYKYGLSKFPDKLIETTGGPFYHLMSRIFSQKRSLNIYIPQINSKIAFPWGFASGAGQA